VNPRRYCVERVKLNGDRTLVVGRLTEREAIARAGVERDRMSDFDVSLGWDYVVARMKFGQGTAQHGASGRGQGQRRYQSDTRGGHLR